MAQEGGTQNIFCLSGVRILISSTLILCCTLPPPKQDPSKYKFFCFDSLGDRVMFKIKKHGSRIHRSYSYARPKRRGPTKIHRHTQVLCAQVLTTWSGRCSQCHVPSLNGAAPRLQHTATAQFPLRLLPGEFLSPPIQGRALVAKLTVKFPVHQSIVRAESDHALTDDSATSSTPNRIQVRSRSANSAEAAGHLLTERKRLQQPDFKKSYFTVEGRILRVLFRFSWKNLHSNVFRICFKCISKKLRS